MFYGRSLNNKINRIYEQALRLIYQHNLSFSELLNLGNSVTVHQKNLQVPMTEIYKVKTSPRNNERYFQTAKSFI